MRKGKDIRTIQQFRHIYAQGEYVRTLPDGRIVINVDGQDLVGKEIKNGRQHK